MSWSSDVVTSKPSSQAFVIGLHVTSGSSSPSTTSTCHIRSRRSEKRLTSLSIRFSYLGPRALLRRPLPMQFPGRMSQLLHIPPLLVRIPRRCLTSSQDHMPQRILSHPDRMPHILCICHPSYVPHLMRRKLSPIKDLTGCWTYLFNSLRIE